MNLPLKGHSNVKKEYQNFEFHVTDSKERKENVYKTFLRSLNRAPLLFRAASNTQHKHENEMYRDRKTKGRSLVQSWSNSFKKTKASYPISCCLRSGEENGQHLLLARVSVRALLPPFCDLLLLVR